MASDKESTHRWIWLRGLARHSVHWGPFTESFKKHFPHDEIEMLDIRGNGKELSVPSYLTVEENVRDLRSRSELLKKGPVNLLSISLGSMIAVEWARLFPQDLSQVVLMTASDGGTSSFYERLHPRNYVPMLKTLFVQNNPLKVEELIMSMVAPDTKDQGLWIQEFGKHPLTKPSNIVRQLIAASRYTFPKKKPDVPILILASRGDRFVSPACTERIAKMWNLSAEWHSTAGHEMALDQPEWVAQKIENWLE